MKDFDAKLGLKNIKEGVIFVLFSGDFATSSFVFLEGLLVEKIDFL